MCLSIGVRKKRWAQAEYSCLALRRKLSINAWLALWSTASVPSDVPGGKVLLL